MNLSEATRFCDAWLPAWTGNQPHRLLSFYAGDAVYRDPANPLGLRGADALARYFAKLLAANPSWRWKAVEIAPTERGFTLKWEAKIPVADLLVVEQGLDIVELVDGKIARNEVYFDRTAILQAHGGRKAP